MRAPDLGYAPRFLSMFLALAESRFEGDSTLPPQAGNASRWAACHAKLWRLLLISLKIRRLAMSLL